MDQRFCAGCTCEALWFVFGSYMMQEWWNPPIMGPIDTLPLERSNKHGSFPPEPFISDESLSPVSLANPSKCSKWAREHLLKSACFLHPSLFLPSRFLFILLPSVHPPWSGIVFSLRPEPSLKVKLALGNVGIYVIGLS